MKKKVVMMLGVVMLCGIVGCGSASDKTKNTTNTSAKNEEQEVVNEDSKKEKISKEISESQFDLVEMSFKTWAPDDWFGWSGSYNDATPPYTDKGRTFMIIGDATEYLIGDNPEELQNKMYACTTLDDMPEACMPAIERKLNLGYTTTKYKYDRGITGDITEQELVTVNGMDMVKAKGNVAFEYDGEESQHHKFIAYYMFHDPTKERAEKYPIYLAYFYQDGADEEEIESYAYSTAALIELTD